MKIEDAAWLAGYIDGDGCICLGKKGGAKYRQVRIVIDSADIEILDHVISIAGGSLVKKTKAKDHHRQCWSWRLCGMNNIVAVLSAIRPFMRCADKKARADMIVEEWAACTPRNGFYTPEMAAQKAAFESKFLAIGNDRGSRSFSPLAA